MINKLRKYNFQTLVYGKNDCNLQFLECYEPEIYEEIVGRYTTKRGGSVVANRLCGYRSIQELIDATPTYTKIDPRYATRDDFFIDGIHIAICLGNKTFAYIGDESFGVVDTNIFVNDAKYTAYRKVV